MTIQHDTILSLDLTISGIEKQYPIEFITTNSGIDKMLKEINTLNPRSISVDTETDGLDPYLNNVLLLQINTLESTYVIDCTRDLDFGGVKELLERKSLVKILHNSIFDIKMLKAGFNISITSVMDTMLAAKIVATEDIFNKVSLKDVSLKYLEFEMDKDVRDSFGDKYDGQGFTEEMIIYSAVDVIILRPLLNKLFGILKKKKLSHVFALENNVAEVISQTELNGIRLDVESYSEHLPTLIAESDEAFKDAITKLGGTVELDETTGLIKRDKKGKRIASINLNSPKQLKEAIFNSTGIQLESTAKDILDKIDNPAIKALRTYKQLDAEITKFSDQLLTKVNEKTGRVHPSFSQIGAITGRMSCRTPNVQQIPSPMRKFFKSKKGFKTITCDYSQAELVITSVLAKDEIMQEAFINGEDLHRATAARIFNVPVSEVTDVQRKQAKGINFGVLYGKGANSLAADLEIPPQQSQELLNTYFDTYKGVASYCNEASNFCVTNRKSYTMLGRVSDYTSIPEDDLEAINKLQRQGRNTPIQGTNADITKIAMCLVSKRLKEYKYAARIVNAVHDEIVVEAREDVVAEVEKLVVHEMRRAMRFFLKGVPAVVDAKVEDSWIK